VMAPCGELVKSLDMGVGRVHGWLNGVPIILEVLTNITNG